MKENRKERKKEVKSKKQYSEIKRLKKKTFHDWVSEREKEVNFERNTKVKDVNINIESDQIK